MITYVEISNALYQIFYEDLDENADFCFNKLDVMMEESIAQADIKKAVSSSLRVTTNPKMRPVLSLMANYIE